LDNTHNHWKKVTILRLHVDATHIFRVDEHGEYSEIGGLG